MNGMKIKVMVEPSAGLAELTAAEQGATPPNLLSQVDDFALTPGIAGSSLDAELREAIKTAGTETTEGRVSDALWMAIYNLLHPIREEVTGREEVSFSLDAYRLYVPAVAGAKVKLTVTSEQASKGSASFKIPGIGGGREWTLKITQELSRSVNTSERVEVSVPATFERVERRRDGQLLASYPKLVSIRSHDVSWDFLPLDPPDIAGLGLPLEKKQFDQRKRTGGTTAVTVTLEEGTTWEVSSGLKLPNLGLEAELKVNGSYGSKLAFAYELPDGHVYVAQHFASVPGFVWTVGPA